MKSNKLNVQKKEPTLPEIVSEASKDLVEDGSKVGRFCVKAAINFYNTNLFLYRIATGVRKISDFENRTENHSESDIAANSLGMTTGLFGVVGQMILYIEHPKYILAIPVTNVASIVYEKFRKAKNKMREERGLSNEK